MGCFWLTARSNCDSVRSVSQRGRPPLAPAAPSIVERGGQVLQVVAKILAQRRMRQRQFDRRLQVAELAAAVEAPAGETMRIHPFMLEQARDTVGQLDLPARALADVFELIEDPGRQYGAAAGLGFSTMLRMRLTTPSPGSTSTMPYLSVSRFGTSSTPSTLPPRSAKVAAICFRH